MTKSQNATFNEWNERHGIWANVYHVSTPVANVLRLQDDDVNLPDEQLDIDPLSYRHMAATLDTVPVDASSNREDILTQSQMLKSVDRECFIQLQKTKIDGLLKFDVMDIHPMELSPKTSA